MTTPIQSVKKRKKAIATKISYMYHRVNPAKIGPYDIKVYSKNNIILHLVPFMIGTSSIKSGTISSIYFIFAKFKGISKSLCFMAAMAVCRSSIDFPTTLTSSPRIDA